MGAVRRTSQSARQQARQPRAIASAARPPPPAPGQAGASSTLPVSADLSLPASLPVPSRVGDLNLAPVNTASQMSPTHLHPPAPGWVGDGRAVPASHPLPLTPAYPHLPAGDSYQMSAATALPWFATLHHLPAPGRAGDSHLMPAATALPLPTARHHLPVPSRAGDAHTTPRMWTAPAMSPPSGSSGCSRCCSAAVLSPPGSSGSVAEPPPLDPSFRQHPPALPATNIPQWMDVAGLCRLLPWKSYTGVRPGPASGRPSSAAPPRISEYDCDLIWDRSSDAAVSGPLDEHIVTVIKSF